jgi:hypothetical protein
MTDTVQGTGQLPAAIRMQVSGNPTPEELAAVVAVLAARPAAAPAAAPVAVSRWNDPAALMRRPLRPGPEAWAAPLA